MDWVLVQCVRVFRIHGIGFDWTGRYWFYTNNFLSLLSLVCGIPLSCYLRESKFSSGYIYTFSASSSFVGTICEGSTYTEQWLYDACEDPSSKGLNIFFTFHSLGSRYW